VGAYVTLRVVLIWLYIRAGRANPDVAGLCRRYASGFSLAAAFWLLSMAGPEWLRMPIWLVAIATDYLTVPLGRHQQALAPLSVSHVPDRFSLFTIIQVGLVVGELLHGALGRPMSPALSIAGMAGLALSYALWWLYYDNLEGRSLRDPMRAGQIWLVAHVVLNTAITVLGVAMGHLIASPMPYAPERVAFGLAMTACYLALAALHAIVQCRDMHFKAWSRLAAACCVLPLAWLPLRAAVVLAVAAVVALVQLGVELRRFGTPGDFMDAG
jgi:low temperature requirement protein LtrA